MLAQERFLLLILMPAIFYTCGGKKSNTDQQDDTLIFRTSLSPAFDEKASITLTQNKSKSEMRVLLLQRAFSDKPVDTFYFKKFELTKAQFENFDRLVIKQSRVKQPKQWTGCCDGMPVEYQIIRGTDTNKLYFRSPDINNDSLGYKVTKSLIDQLIKIYSDSVLTDYFNDVESYMDESKHHIKRDQNRPINRLRQIEYSR